MSDELKNQDEAVTPEYAEASEGNPVAEAWDEGVKTVMETIAEGADSTDHIGHEHHYSDEVILPYFGHIGTMPGGIYTFVFGVLAVLTLLEVFITLILPENLLKISLLAIFSLIKAYLVVMYYMHLNQDHWFYRVALLLPLIISLLSTAFLLFVPAGAGLGYY